VAAAQAVLPFLYAGIYLAATTNSASTPDVQQDMQEARSENSEVLHALLLLPLLLLTASILSLHCARNDTSGRIFCMPKSWKLQAAAAAGSSSGDRS
jgi:hypothetical protein